MGIFQRITQLITSNLNDAITKSEDPKKMLHQALLEMNQQYQEARVLSAKAIASVKQLEKQLEGERAQAAEWERRAMLAVRAGEDELAKNALLRQREHDALANDLQTMLNKQTAEVDKLKNALLQLQTKIETAKRKVKVLETKATIVEARKNIHGLISGMNDNSADETIKRMEEKIAQEEAEGDALIELHNNSAESLEKKFKEMETVGGAELMLAEMKAKMGVGAKTEAPKANRESAPPVVQYRVTAEPTTTATATAAQEEEHAVVTAQASAQAAARAPAPPPPPPPPPRPRPIRTEDDERELQDLMRMLQESERKNR